jgi:hypothetical protein
MDYIDWVEKVMSVVAQKWKGADGNAKLIGLQLSAIYDALGQSELVHEHDYELTKFTQAVRDALKDLTSLGLLDDHYQIFFKVTSEGNKYPLATLSTCWPQIMKVYIDEDQESILRGISEIGQEFYDGFVCIRDLTGEQVFAHLGWAWDTNGTSKCYALAKQLSDMGLLTQRPYFGGHIDLIPKYTGIVRVTRKVDTDQIRLLKELIEDWETTNVDFKRELNLKNDKEKAEFVRDILGIANTKSSGRRFLVIGFDDDSRTFFKTVDPTNTQERMEQILHAYCDSYPNIKYYLVPWQTGEAGLIEIFREPEKLPFKVGKPLGGQKGIQQGEIFVRHGSHTEPPTERELQDLIGEASRAKPK